MAKRKSIMVAILILVINVKIILSQHWSEPEILFEDPTQKGSILLPN